MTIVSPFRGASEPDVAHVNFGGVSYRCFLFLDATRTSNRVVAKIFTDGEDGQTVLERQYVVRTAPANEVLDCPKVIPINQDSEGNGTTGFIAHWIEGDYEGTVALHRALFDVTDIPGGWVYKGSATLYSTGQYDVDVIEGELAEFVVARRTGITTVTVTRFVDDYDWIDTTWGTNVTANIDDTILGVVASDTDGAVLIAYQDDGTNTVSLGPSTMVTYLAAGAGTEGSTIETGGDILDGDNEFPNVGLCRVTANIYALVTEWSNTAERVAGGIWTASRGVAVRGLDTSTTDVAIETDSHWCRHLHLVSRPWAWASGVTLVPEVYALVGFKSIADGQEWDQTYGYFVKFDWPAILGSSTAGEVFPIMVGAIMDGSFDGSPSGESPGALDLSVGKRMNHVSHVSGPPLHTLGPYGKSIMVAAMHWSRILFVQDGSTDIDTEPVIARVSGLWFTHEDPWTIRRDAREAAQPDTPAWTGVPRISNLPVEVPGVLVVTGGATSVYDGQQLVELGFAWTPEIMSAVISNGTGLEAVGDYFYTANYAWPDAKGQLHRGPPSRPVQITTIDTTNRVTLTIKTLSLSLKGDALRYPVAPAVAVEIWRTYILTGTTVVADPVAGTYLFKRVWAGPLSGYMLQETPRNDRDAFSIAPVDAQTNAIIQYNDLLSFQLDPSSLQWTPPPPIPHVPLRVAWVWQNRLFGYDRDVLRWSEQILPMGTQYVLPEFNDVNTFRLDDVGPLTAGIAMDNASILFTRESIFQLVGDPGAGGVGINLDLQVVSRGTGCIEPRSVVQTKDGVMFQSKRGLHLLTRAMQVEFIGSPIEDLVKTAGNVRSSVHIEDRYQVRFTLQGTPGTGPLDVQQRIAIYDYRFRQWCVAELPNTSQASGASRLNEMQHATSWRGRQGEFLHVVMSQGSVSIERSDDDATFADENTTTDVAIPLDIETEWIHLAGISGLKRIKEIGFQTERLDAGETTIEAWFDIDGSYDDSGAADQTLVVTSPADGYIRFRPNIEKLTGIRLRIYESGTVPQTENLRLVSLTLHYTTKPSLRRVAL